MMAVDDYYNQVEMTEAIDKRRVFIASDDPKVKIKPLRSHISLAQ